MEKQRSDVGAGFPRPAPGTRAQRLRPYIVMGILLISVLLLFVSFCSPSARESTIDLRSIHWEIADTDELRQRGLSDRPFLGKDAGMMFVFSERGIHPFWMKDTYFPLDIIWLDGERVVDVATLPASIQANGTHTFPPASHLPLKKADRVLELNAGQAQELNIGIGSTVILP